MVWTLESCYKLGKLEIADLLEEILVTAQIEIIDASTVWRALQDYRSGKGDFADYYIGGAYANAGAELTFTFERASAPTEDSTC